MRIGYACLTLGVQNTQQKTCTMKNADAERLTDLIRHNLNALEAIVDYNIANDIRLFRISSDLIPFASSPVNTLHWWELFSERFQTIGKKIRNSGMRVSMHPGQYTVLNSPDEDVVQRAVWDLEYHAQVLDSLDVDSEHKIILHIGGVYGDKLRAVERFGANYQNLSPKVKDRLVIENDDKSYTVTDVLEISEKNQIPVIFDNLHHRVNPCGISGSDVEWVNACGKTWKMKDGPQKIHYSQQDTQKKPGAHSTTIGIHEFMDFYRALGRHDLDIMLEVKDKNLSALKCILCTSPSRNLKAIEEEWSRYKYKVLENSHEGYNGIRQMLRDKATVNPVAFYAGIEDALQQEITCGGSVNAALHVWGYFKNVATEKEKAAFLRDMKAFEQGGKSLLAIKNVLWKLAVKYQQQYLLNSYYFIL